MNNDKKSMNNKPEQSEDLVYDIISFLKEWGLWNDIMIFCNDRKYTDIIWDEDPDPTYKGFRDLEDVYEIRDVKLSDYLGEDSAKISQKLSPVCVMNETLLSHVFFDGYYEAEWNNIGPQARKYLLDPAGGNILLDMFDYDAEELEPILNPSEFDSQEQYEDFEDEMQEDLYWEFVDRLYDDTICCCGYPVVDHIIEQWRALSAKYGVGEVSVYC